ncbi:Ser/Thr protein kinase RdoA (MazF antagonist) [Streptosporangium becharense]|uniref:Ser/Thr protein kinase RdoA (MazF antagonist) n=1 Tax=Streptosporangium becharense TaxID=1816182 RepID=A0A7W9MHZ3_9ACTN|nr:phosphotransferase [Streptosporangium becharense]MBB2911305.1 Ser/Thr protein kinase RdoA (MazF antagonist) [Streptosporangium becharense]MBB5821637.1 Ser/Thr protein kinase RdoA (MazF antagonist) [Streptosporangium becharense]
MKATSSGLNAYARDLYLQEARVHLSLPAELTGPALSWTLEWENWVVLAFPVVPGGNPPTPWSTEDVDAVLRALDAMRGQRLDASYDLPEADVHFAAAFESWRSLSALDIGVLHPWSARWLDALIDLEQRAVKLLRGSQLLHADLRSDNIIVTPGRPPVFVDWAYACRGNALVDVVYFLLSVAADNGTAPEDATRRITSDYAANPEDVTAIIAGFAGWFSSMARQPSPVGLPTLRPFQARMAETARAWTEQRTGWR